LKHIFIINPAAGKRNCTTELYAAADQLRDKHGLDCQCMLTQRPGHATELCRSIAETGEEVRFYACGGDGTINEVLNGIVGFPNAAMTCIPVGTGNDFLKNFGPEMAEKFKNVRNLFDGPQKQLDVIECNGRYALTIACSGFDAKVADDVHKFGSGKASYIAALTSNFFFRKFISRWTLSVDGVAVEGDYTLVACCNGRYYGGGFMPVAHARMDDGVLDTLIVKGITRPAFLSFVADYSKGNYWKFPHLAKCVQGKVIRIQSEEEDIVTCLDGEIMRSRDVTLQLSDKKVNFFGPVGFDCNATAREK